MFTSVVHLFLDTLPTSSHPLASPNATFVSVSIETARNRVAISEEILGGRAEGVYRRGARGQRQLVLVSGARFLVRNVEYLAVIAHVHATRELKRSRREYLDEFRMLP